jgi:hypothetical protein
MSRPLPNDAQAVNRAADGLIGDLDPMMVAQILTQQRGGPDGGVIAERPGVAVDYRGDQFVEGAAGRAWPAETRGVEESRPEVQAGTFLEPAQPVVDGLAADIEQFGDFGDVGPLGEPEQGLGSASLLGQGGAGDDAFQFAALPVTERESGHRFTPPKNLVNRGPFYLSKNFCRQESILAA